MLDEGKLPNFAKLRDQGSFKPLGSTLPPISPVAWSSFQTGTNPGKHNVFDFLTPDLKTYAPSSRSVEIRPPRRMIKIGEYQFPLSKPEVRLLAQEQAVLERFVRPRNHLRSASGTHHVSAREDPRSPAFRHVRPRPARHSGHVFLLHHQAQARRREDRRRDRTMSRAQANRSRSTWSVRQTRF